MRKNAYEKDQNCCTILGVRFAVGETEKIMTLALRGGLVVVPSAPVLVASADNAVLREALVGSDLAITDSGLMVLFWRILTGENLIRVSGLKYLKLLLEKSDLQRPGAVLWVMPNAQARDRALQCLRARGLFVSAEDFYLAPSYPAGRLFDPELLALVQSRRPLHIIIAIGGGTQERLGYSLKQSLSYRPGIHCIGAAIGFLSGDQVRIPTWADYLYLGWLFRCLSAPGKFVPRYWRARQLIGLMWRYREKLPPVKDQAI